MGRGGGVTGESGAGGNGPRWDPEGRSSLFPHPHISPCLDCIAPGRGRKKQLRGIGSTGLATRLGLG